MTAPQGPKPRASCAECGTRPAVRADLFCGPCRDALTRSAEAYGPLVDGVRDQRPVAPDADQGDLWAA